MSRRRTGDIRPASVLRKRTCRLEIVVERGSNVPTYVLLSSLTPEGRQTLHAHPDRVNAVNDEIHAFGCKVIDQYAVLGPYDFVTVVEAPDNETAAHLSVDLGSRGTISILTLPAIGMDDFQAQLQRKEQLGHN
jgi:uncharacterized protein with GYD domain